jgi:uncharacterized protein (DUF58 family)
MRLSYKQTLTIVFVFIIFIVFLGLGLINGVPVSANKLTVSIAPDKQQYSLGEEVNVSFYIENTLWFPVRYPAYTRVTISATVDGQRVKGGFDMRVTPVASTIFIPPGGRHNIWNSTFVPEQKGVLRIVIGISGPEVNIVEAKEVNIT